MNIHQIEWVHKLKRTIP